MHYNADPVGHPARVEDILRWMYGSLDPGPTEDNWSTKRIKSKIASPVLTSDTCRVPVLTAGVGSGVGK